MIEVADSNGAISFRVQVVPRASRSELAGEHNGALKVRVAAAPVAGAANKELVQFLARLLGVSRAAVEITSGQTGRLKRLRITGLSANSLTELLRKTGSS